MGVHASCRVVSFRTRPERVSGGGVYPVTVMKWRSDTKVLERLAHLPVARDTAEHYRGYLRRQLVMNRCGDCDRWHHPMRPMCPACWSWNVLPTPVKGRGTVHLFLALHQGPSADGVDYSQGPHPVVAVELEEQEGLRFTGTIVDCTVADAR